jgi:hypothetical protein
MVFENTHAFDGRFLSTTDPVQYKDRKLQGLSNALRWILVFRDATMTGVALSFDLFPYPPIPYGKAQVFPSHSSLSIRSDSSQ